jgi:hypothetical protein
MASKKVVVISCDLCGTEDLVETHNMVVDGNPIEFEACDSCWGKTLEPIAILAKVGRKPPKLVKVSGRKNVMEFPGESWKFTAHALGRMGSRHISPTQACKAADDPQITRGARDPKAQVRVRNHIKVVVDEERRLILTVSNETEEDEAVA